MAKKKKKKKRALPKDAWLLAEDFRQLARTTLIAKYGHKCLKCGSTKYLHIDHIFPKYDFPEKTFNIDNLQLLCSACNTAKMRSIADYRPKDIPYLTPSRFLRVRIPFGYSAEARVPLIDKPFKPKTILRKKT